MVWHCLDATEWLPGDLPSLENCLLRAQKPVSESNRDAATFSIGDYCRGAKLGLIFVFLICRIDGLCFDRRLSSAFCASRAAPRGTEGLMLTSEC